jgi:dTDP-4-dehydrorhamnose reductase
MQTILITGGSGFLGGYLVKAAEKYFSVAATYFQNKPDYPAIHWLQVDFSTSSEIKLLLHKIQPDIVIHNAAMTNVDLCEKEQAKTRLVNIQANELLAMESKKTGTRVLYISTDLVFDGDAPPYSESSQPNPLSFYGWSKWQGELAVTANNPNHVIVRPAIMYGPPALLGTSFSEWMRLSWLNKQATKLFTDQYRTPIFAGNLAAAIIELAQSDFTGLIHLAGDERISRYQFGLCLTDYLKSDRKFVVPAGMNEVALTGKRPADVSLNIALARKLLKTEFLDCRNGIQAAYRLG